MGARGSGEDIGNRKEQAGGECTQTQNSSEKNAEPAGSAEQGGCAGREQEPNTAAAGDADAKDKEAQRVNKEEVLGKILVAVERRINSGEMKPTIGDLVRLWQLEKDLGIDQPKEVKVQWVDRPTPDAASGE